MKIILSSKTTLELSKADTKALYDEIRFACNEVSVFPMLERVRALMEI